MFWISALRLFGGSRLRICEVLEAPSGFEPEMEVLQTGSESLTC
jgi:hypothetical protein